MNENFFFNVIDGFLRFDLCLLCFEIWQNHRKFFTADASDKIVFPMKDCL